MSTGVHPGMSSLTPDAARDADRMCTAFEIAWRAGGRPRTEDFCPPDTDAAILGELLAIEIEYRCRAGERLTSTELVGRFPRLDARWLTSLVSEISGESPQADSAPSPPGRMGGRMGRFELLERIGSGAGGAVWKARDPELGRAVALKVPHAGLVDTPETLERFRREARAAARLRHPNVAAVHEVTEADGRPVIVQELVEGQSLRALLADHKLSPREAARITCEAAEALDYAHRMGVVHRDVKPANLMVSEAANGTPGRVVVIDFGLALDAALVSLTTEGQVVGTPAYMAPEQAAGDAHRVDARSDVYALGAVLYESLCQSPPFRGNRAAVLRQLIEVEPPRPRKVTPGVPRDLETICLKAMAKEPHRRYPSARDMADDLRRYLRGESIRARPVGPLSRAWRWARRHPAPVALMAITTVALAAVVGVAAEIAVNWELQEAIVESANAQELVQTQYERRDAVLYANQMALASREWAAGNSGRVSELLADCPERFRGWEWQYLEHQLRRDLMTLTHSSPSASRPVLGVAYAPDGARLASCGWDGSVAVWDAATGKESFRLKRKPPVDAGVSCVAWSPDGAFLAAGYWDGAVYIWEARSEGTPHRIFPGHDNVVYALAFGPDGRHVAVGGGPPWWSCPEGDCGGKPGGVWVWEIATGQRVKMYTRSAWAVTAVAFHPTGRYMVTAEGALPFARTSPGVGDHPGDLILWDTNSGEKVRDYRGHRGPLTTVAFSPDGARLAAGGADPEFFVWDADNGNRLAVMTGYRGWVRGLAFRPGGRQLASVGGDGSVRVWDPSTGRPDHTYRAHSQVVTCVAYSPDGLRIASGSADNTVRVWDAEQTPECRRLVHSGAVSGLVYTPDGSQVVTISNHSDANGVGNSELRVWDAAGGETLTRISSATVLHTVAVANGRVAAAGHGRGVRLWDIDPAGAMTGERTVYPGKKNYPVTEVAISPNGRWLAASGALESHRVPGGPTRCEFNVCEASSGQSIWRHESDHGEPVAGVAFSPKGNVIATTGHNGMLWLHDTASGRQLMSFRPHERYVAAAAFSPDGRRVVTASWDYEARIWDATSLISGHPKPVPLAILRGHTGKLHTVAFSPDGRRVVTGGEDESVKVWDAENGREVLTLTGHTDVITRVAFSPDSKGRTLASASNDGTVRLWDSTGP